jgi:hypothetical protein
MASLIETDEPALLSAMNQMLASFSSEESVERVALRGRWRRARRPAEGEIFSTIGRNGPICIAATLPQAFEVALVAIWTGEDDTATVELIGVVRAPDMPVQIHAMADAWRAARGLTETQSGRKRWSGLEDPL